MAEPECTLNEGDRRGLFALPSAGEKSEEAASRVRRLTRLTRFALNGLRIHAEDTVVEREDIELMCEIAEAADLWAPSEMAPRARRGGAGG